MTTAASTDTISQNLTLISSSICSSWRKINMLM